MDQGQWCQPRRPQFWRDAWPRPQATREGVLDRGSGVAGGGIAGSEQRDAAWVLLSLPQEAAGHSPDPACPCGDPGPAAPMGLGLGHGCRGLRPSRRDSTPGGLQGFPGNTPESRGRRGAEPVTAVSLGRGSVQWPSLATHAVTGGGCRIIQPRHSGSVLSPPHASLAGHCRGGEAAAAGAPGLAVPSLLPGLAAWAAAPRDGPAVQTAWAVVLPALEYVTQEVPALPAWVPLPAKWVPQHPPVTRTQ